MANETIPTHTVRLETYQTFGNSHAVCRHETWNFRPDLTFATRKLAEDYVKMKNSQLPEFVMLSRGLSNIECDDFATEFSFGKKYLHHCRWFIHPPPKADIIACLTTNGITVEK
jgi:hypothetical protein